MKPSRLGSFVSSATAWGIPLVVAFIASCSATSPRTLSALDASGSTEAGGNDSAILTNLVDAMGNEVPGILAVDVEVVVVDSSQTEAGAACLSAFAGCVSFTDSTAVDADRTVHFQDYDYNPKCLMVRAGQIVTFSGDFIRHPLTPSCGPELLLEYRDTATAASFVMGAVGIYGYYCLDHGNPQGDVMSGAIQVVP
jgi:plastocyanin